MISDIYRFYLIWEFEITVPTWNCCLTMIRVPADAVRQENRKRVPVIEWEYNIILIHVGFGFFFFGGELEVEREGFKQS